MNHPLTQRLLDHQREEAYRDINRIISCLESAKTALFYLDTTRARNLAETALKQCRYVLGAANMIDRIKPPTRNSQ